MTITWMFHTQGVPLKLFDNYGFGVPISQSYPKGKGIFRCWAKSRLIKNLKRKALNHIYFLRSSIFAFGSIRPINFKLSKKVKMYLNQGSDTFNQAPHMNGFEI